MCINEQTWLNFIAAIKWHFILKRLSFAAVFFHLLITICSVSFARIRYIGSLCGSKSLYAINQLNRNWRDQNSVYIFSPLDSVYLIKLSRYALISHALYYSISNNRMYCLFVASVCLLILLVAVFYNSNNSSNSHHSSSIGLRSW